MCPFKDTLMKAQNSIVFYCPPSPGTKVPEMFFPPPFYSNMLPSEEYTVYTLKHLLYYILDMFFCELYRIPVYIYSISFFKF